MIARVAVFTLTVVFALALPLEAQAHGTEEHRAPDTTLKWSFEPLSVIGVVASISIYAIGLARLWHAAGTGRGIRAGEAWSFAAGWVVLAVALVSPLHPLGEVLFSAHMIQHELLMLVAAPLLVLGRPGIAFLHALPGSSGARLGHGVNRPWLRPVVKAVTFPLAAFVIHAAVLWAWHAPILMNAVLNNTWVHALQHISFIASAILFWWAVINTGRSVAGYGSAVLYLFVTALHSGLLGVLITYARRVLYTPYTDTTAPWGLTPLEDQQLGGLIMWIPACLVYVLAGLILLAGWIRQSEQGALKWEHSITTPGPSPAGPT